MISEMPAHRQNDLPFHSGSLRLSVFRESPPTPSRTYGASQKFDAIFQSFVKRRPLSESFALTTYDLSSSSSDEDLSDPVPESPLDLSDAENMASGYNSPSLFSRRRHKVVASSQSKDNRPKSLYDAAKPRPPSKEKQHKHEKGNSTSVGEKLSRLMHLRPWRSADASKHEESSYQRTFDPVPPNRWTNVINHDQGPVRQPRPPTTSPTNPMANPRKKRHAPKPPTNVAPYNSQDVVPQSNTATEDNKQTSGTNPEADLTSPIAKPTCPSSSNPSDNVFESSPDSTPPMPPARTPKKSKLTQQKVTNSNVETPKVHPQSTVTPNSSITTPHEVQGLAIEPPISRTVAGVTQQSILTNVEHYPHEQPETTGSPVLQAKLCLQVMLSESPPTPEKISTKNAQTAESSDIGKVMSPCLSVKSGTESNPVPNTSQYSPHDLSEPHPSHTPILQKAVSVTSNCHSSTIVNDNNPETPSLVTIKTRESQTARTSEGIGVDDPLLRENDETVEHTTRMVLEELLQAVEATVGNSAAETISSFDPELGACNREKAETETLTTNPQSSEAKAEDGSVLETEKTVPSSKKVQQINDVTMSNDDVTNKSNSIGDGHDEPPQKSRKHRKSVDNASSGYSSPGSGDEGPISPETPLSPLAIPSPTSSYYSASLSASSSRVSNLSRELTLAKPVQNEEGAVPAKTTQAQQEKRPQVTKTNSSELASKTDIESNEKTPENAENSENSAEKATKSENDAIQAPTKPVLADTRMDLTLPFDTLPDMPVKFRTKPSANRVRAKSEYIPYRSDTDDFTDEINLSRVSISMIEKPIETASLSKAQARLFKPTLNKGSRKKALAAQKSRAFAMRARPHWSQRHSYAEPSSYVLNETDQEVSSSNLVSHFVSTQNISTYYDGKEQKTITPHEILTSKREEFFNAFKNTTLGRDPQQFGGSVRQLPVSAKEFGFIHSIQEVTELDSPVKPEKPFIPKTAEKSAQNDEEITCESNKENLVQRQHSGASSTGSSTHNSSQNSSLCTGSTWSLSTDMASHSRHRKSSLRKRLQGAFSFQNIRKAISMEKLNDEEKRRSMSHHYLNENGTQYIDSRQRSATLQEKSTYNNNNNEPSSNLRKAPSISSIISSVRMRKRRSRTKEDATKRNTIADPEVFAKRAEAAPETRRSSTLRPMSMVLSNTSRRKLEDVGNPNFFRPIGRVLQMNPAEGTLLVEMVKPPSGPFGFYIARKKDSGDSGSVFISRLSDSYPDKMFAGLMRKGDEITEINGTAVSNLTLDQVYDLILDSERTLLKLKPSQVHVV